MVVTNKSLSLNVFPLTKAKQNSLFETYNAYFDMVNQLLSIIKEKHPTRAELHKSTYSKFRDNFPSQLIISARVYAWSIRKQKNHKKIIVRFDNRLSSFKQTKKGNPILSIRTISKRIGIPINPDGAYKRFKQHLKKGWQVKSVIMISQFRFYVNLSKEFEEPSVMPNVLGIDMNSGRIALTILSPEGKKLKQLYFGRDIFLRQTRFEQRRAILQSYKDLGDSKARKKFRQLSGRQRAYVKTRIWQIVAEIIRLAKTYNASIGIENLKNLRQSANHLRKKSRKKVNKIPYGLFRFCLKHKAIQEEVRVIAINPYHTSQRCPRCHFESKSNFKGYKLFKCKRCGYEANRDRVASLNIAIKTTVLMRTDVTTTKTVQSIKTGAPVTEHFLSCDICL